MHTILCMTTYKVLTCLVISCCNVDCTCTHLALCVTCKILSAHLYSPNVHAAYIFKFWLVCTMHICIKPCTLYMCMHVLCIMCVCIHYKLAILMTYFAWEDQIQKCTILWSCKVEIYVASIIYFQTYTSHSVYAAKHRLYAC